MIRKEMATTHEPVPNTSAFTFRGPWFTAAEARAYVCCKTMGAWYVWRKTHGIVRRSNGTVAKADLDRALRFRKKWRVAEATRRNLRNYRGDGTRTGKTSQGSGRAADS